MSQSQSQSKSDIKFKDLTMIEIIGDDCMPE
jgi:hypothetical protein